MGIEYTSVIDHPLAAVFAWHGRPGAMSRLIPPWSPMSAISEARSLSDGMAVLGLPGPLQWVARHNPHDYDPPHRFVDELSYDGPRSWPTRAVGWWRHVHDFAEDSTTSTRVTDRVDTPVPAALLRSMFVYRHRQLAADLTAHRDAAEAGLGPLVVAVTGASGLVGSALCAFLTTGGHRVVRLVRRRPNAADERYWETSQPDEKLLSGVDVVVHLAGASIAGRFTDSHKSAIRDSRIGPTRTLAELAARTETLKAMISASAVGYYGYDRGDELLTEDSQRGDGFLADVVSDWEAATAPASEAGLRVVNLRTGIVQSARGGTLRLLHPLFAAGLGGRLGSGEQWLSWIGIDDLVDAYYRSMYDETLRGPVNAVAPNAVRNTEYTVALAGVLHRPAVVPVPRLAPKLLLGEQGAQELAEANQHVVPAKLAASGHRFRHEAVIDALAHQLGREAP
ncbi:MAG: TIGR01777 family oxidoreductase [Mycobacterium sp.]